MPLSKEVTTFGTVEFNETKEANISARQKARIVKLYVNYTGQMVEQGEKLAVLDVRYSPELTVTLDDLKRARQRGDRDAEDMARQRLKLWDVGDGQIDEFLKTGKVGTELTVTSPIKGHVVKKYQREGSFVDEGTPLYDMVDLDSVWIEAQVYEADQALLREGLTARGDDPRPARRGLRGQTRLRLPAPGRGQPDPDGALRHPQPRPPAAARHVHDRQDRRAADEDRPPRRGRGRGLGRAERRRRPAHALAAPSGASAGAGLAPLLYAAGREAVLSRGMVLAVPDGAVIDTGNLKVVYREASPDVFEGVAVRLGPRMAMQGDPTAYYPVLAGLEAGDRVVTHGSFLIDAETRLNPAAGSIYFGGTGGKAAPASTVRPSTPEDDNGEDGKVRANLAKLSPTTGGWRRRRGLPHPRPTGSARWGRR